MRYYFGAKTTHKSSFSKNMAQIDANLEKIKREFFFIFQSGELVVICNKGAAD